MSYILDALRKADAQRERDPARGIHAQPLTAMPARHAGGPGLSRRWWVAGGLLVLALAAAAGWRWSGEAAPAPVRLSGRDEAPSVPVAAALPAPPARAAAVLPAPPPVVMAPIAPPPVVMAPRADPRKAGAREPGKDIAAPTPPAAVAQAPAAATASDRVHGLGELPQDVRRDLPKLAISGAVYSANPAQRMLIINGQVFNEGGEPAPGVVLEQIRPKAAVLKFRGLRYSVGY
jgi:general secretion pathway protein B